MHETKLWAILGPLEDLAKSLLHLQAGQWLSHIPGMHEVTSELVVQSLMCDRSGKDWYNIV